MKFIMMWNAGYGDESAVIDTDSIKEAEEEAYHAWKEAAEQEASYSAVKYTEELAEDLGLE